jgi:hypothetical protein
VLGRFVYREFARWEPAPPPSPMGCYFSAVAQLSGIGGGPRQLQCRTPPRGGAGSQRALIIPSAETTPKTEDRNILVSTIALFVSREVPNVTKATAVTGVRRVSRGGRWHRVESTNDLYDAWRALARLVSVICTYSRVEGGLKAQAYCHRLERLTRRFTNVSQRAARALDLVSRLGERLETRNTKLETAAGAAAR